jgi:hypothetical protein
MQQNLLMLNQTNFFVAIQIVLYGSLSASNRWMLVRTGLRCILLFGLARFTTGAVGVARCRAADIPG